MKRIVLAAVLLVLVASLCYVGFAQQPAPAPITFTLRFSVSCRASQVDEAKAIWHAFANKYAAQGQWVVAPPSRVERADPMRHVNATGTGSVEADPAKAGAMLVELDQTLLLLRSRLDVLTTCADLQLYRPAPDKLQRMEREGN